MNFAERKFLDSARLFVASRVIEALFQSRIAPRFLGRFRELVIHMQRILITGAAGFVGAGLTRHLVSQGRSVAILLRPASEGRRLGSLLQGLHVIRGDLRDLAAIQDRIRSFSPQGIVHLAWDGVKGADRNGPMQADNVAASVALYRLAEEMECRSFVGLGSQAEYGPKPGLLDERAPTHPTTVYGAAKLATGLLLDRMAAASNGSFAWLRLFSSYGNDDDPSWLLPYLARTLIAGQRPAVTAAEQKWDYIHVDDVVRAIVAALDGSIRGIFNLGSGVARPLRELICLMRDLIDPGLEIGFGELSYRSDQVMHLQADISALRAVTGWTPQVRLEDGLRDLVAWHRSR